MKKVSIEDLCKEYIGKFVPVWNHLDEPPVSIVRIDDIDPTRKWLRYTLFTEPNKGKERTAYYGASNWRDAWIWIADTWEELMPYWYERLEEKKEQSYDND